MSNESAFPPPGTDNSQDLSLSDIASFAQRHAVRLLSLTLIGAAVGVAVSTAAPKQWQAKTVLQVGQITWGTNNITQVESPAYAIERMSMGTFRDDVLRKLNLPLERSQSHSTALLEDYLTLTQVRGTDLVAIQARGSSPEEARRFVETYQQHLIDVHKALQQPVVAQLQAQIAEYKQSLQQMQQHGTSIEAAMDKQINAVGAKATNDLLSGILVQSSLEASDKLRNQIHMLENDLTASRTFNTKPLAEGIQVSDRPVYPKKPIFGGWGALLGFLTGLSVSMLRDRRRSKTPPPGR
ncbi:hypothetical protein PTE30175_04231 [Pandoraea terrae]|uniref:Polysaccharide chain length determinant N-terminal domain-containing protein n=1 Tax=Pandoraea terrae TaxID=1537710 RepID=A0A5E4Y7M1_9BURK|nr:hypothetical protein [Pandoraea terrae]VVE44530.1 hypothetical protein PTE30175_04231 [Pandoraea terrae]